MGYSVGVIPCNPLTDGAGQSEGGVSPFTGEGDLENIPIELSKNNFHVVKKVNHDDFAHFFSNK